MCASLLQHDASAAAPAKLQEAGSGIFSRACVLPGLNARDSASREPLCGC